MPFEIRQLTPDDVGVMDAWLMIFGEAFHDVAG